MIVLCQVTVVESAGEISAKNVLESSGVRDGLCVVLGCGDGKLAVELARSGKLLVHGLTLTEADVDKARVNIGSQGIYGQASVEMLRGKRLPYADNLVNLLVVSDWSKVAAKGVPLSEVVRVTCPDGVMLIGGASEAELNGSLSRLGVKKLKKVQAGSVLFKAVKLRPPEMDEWTHWRYNAEGSGFSKDTALKGAPTGLRWISGPLGPMGSRKNSSKAGFSADGFVLFMTLNESYSMTHKSPDKRKKLMKWHLVARDAYNGLFRWKQPMEKENMYGFRARPYYQAGVPCAIGPGRVYSSTKAKSVTILDIKNGKLLGSCELDGDPYEMAFKNGNLIAATKTSVFSVDPVTAALRWKTPAPAQDMMVSSDGVFFLDRTKATGELVGLDLSGGKEKWRSGFEKLGLPPKKDKRYSPINLRLIQSRVAVLASRKALHGFSVDDGKHLWSVNYPNNPRRFNHVDILAWDGLVWSPAPSTEKSNKGASHSFVWTGYDPKTGEIKKTIKGNQRKASSGCGALLGAGNHIIFCKHLSFLNVETGESVSYTGTRGPCSAYPIPANGLLYTHPYNCGCVRNSILGTMGLAITPNPRTKEAQASAGARLEKGPAFAQPSTINHQPSTMAAQWPMLRYDVQRSATTTVSIPTDLKILWSAKVAALLPKQGPMVEDWRVGLQTGDIVTAPTVGGGMVFAAVPHAHRIVALDAATGKEKWSYTAGGRIDAPPTLYKGLCLFGCNDGWVYCLTAADGKLVWRFRAAPDHTRIMAFGQLESPWPISGSVLVQNDVLAFGCGRTSASDYGYSVAALNPATGELLWEKTSLTPEGTTERALSSTCQTALVGDSKDFYMGTIKFDPKSGAPTALRVEKGKEMPILTARRFGLAYGQWREMGSVSGRQLQIYQFGKTASSLMAIKGNTIFAYLVNFGGKRPPEYLRGSMLYAIDKGKSYVSKAAADYAKKKKGKTIAAGGHMWAFDIEAPVQAEAMIMAGDNLVVAGAMNGWSHEGEGFLWIVSSADGKKLKEYKLDRPPSYEALAVADGRLYVATRSGKIFCYGK